MSRGRRRVASLLPAATEIVAALGAADELVAISHECDYPTTVVDRPRVTLSPVEAEASGAAIDGQVHALVAAGKPVIAVDPTALAAAAPDLIITQDLCEVCAVIDGDVRSLASTLSRPAAVLRLRARDLAGIFADIRTIGAALGRDREAAELVASLEQRLAALPGREAPGRSDHRPRPRVVCLEWLEPPFLAGHWVPELIEAAGGIDIGARPGSHSRSRAWSELACLDPDVVLVMLCGFGLERARREWAEFATTDRGRAVLDSNGSVWLIDGNAYTSRPGPRVVDGAEMIATILAGRPNHEVIGVGGRNSTIG
jgi:iron complex transport system substrate-binding protein